MTEIDEFEKRIAARDTSLFAIHKLLDYNIIQCTYCHSRFFPTERDKAIVGYGFCSSTCSGRYKHEQEPMLRIERIERGY